MSRRSVVELEQALAAAVARRDAAAVDGLPADRAVGRVSAPVLKRVHASTDARLGRFTAAQAEVEAIEHKLGLAKAREREAQRRRFTREDIEGVTHVHDGHGWHEVISINAKTVTVKTPYSWTERVAFDKIHKIARPSSGVRKDQP